MKKLLLALTLFIVSIPGLAQGFDQTHCARKIVNIHVDVLGVKHPSVRYYHPINGTYRIRPKTVEDKKRLKGIKGYLLIQPAKHLTKFETDIQANSLRYYINPSELVYVNWAMGTDSSNMALLDTFKIQSEKTRKEKYQDLIEDYFEPFYISRFEVTNREYREFVNWVTDSLFRDAIYESELVSDEEAVKMLIIPKDVLKNGIYDERNLEARPVSGSRLINREIYPLNWEYDYWKELRDDQIIPSISGLYQRSNERFYKCRQVDTEQLIYRYFDFDFEGYRKDTTVIRGHKERSRFILDTAINIYPDTTCWSKLSWMPFNEPMANMYFWHPAYDDYPVVGISYDQAKAYCHWKQRQLKKEHPEIARYFKFDLPRTYEYEWAISAGFSQMDQMLVQDNELITSLLLGQPNGRKVDRHDSYAYGEMVYTQKVYAPYPGGQKKYLKQKANSKQGKQSTDEWNQAIENEQNRLANGIDFLSNNVSEWMDENYKENYAALIQAYINYNCFANPEYCEYQRHIDQNRLRENDSTGQLIMGGNWYDERYGSYLGINTAGLYPKNFKNSPNSFATVGFRCVIRYKR